MARGFNNNKIKGVTVVRLFACSLGNGGLHIIQGLHTFVTKTPETVCDARIVFRKDEIDLPDGTLF